ncbi:MAG: metallophosphoesterase [Actinomycetota bacterium]
MILPLLGIAAAGAALGVAEAVAVQRTDRTLPVPGLDPRLSGLRIAHLSDFHLGVPGPNAAAAQRAARIAMEAEPDLIAITGDQLSHPRGTDELLELLAGLDAPLGVWAILGNHDLGHSRDPLSRAGPVPDYASAGVRLLRDETVLVERDGARIAVSGIEPRRQERPTFTTPLGAPLEAPWPVVDAELHVVLSHYPDLFDAAPTGSRDVVLAGHLHGGQICVPWPTGRIRLSQLGQAYRDGVFRRGDATLHVTRGVGTTFVPFRILARPEVPVLELVAG